MSSYFLHRDGQNHGPFSQDQIKQLLASGQIGADEMICQEGGSGWIAASALAGSPARRPGPAAAAASAPVVTQEHVDLARQKWRGPLIGITLSVAFPTVLWAAKHDASRGVRPSGKNRAVKELAAQNTDLLPIALIVGVIGVIVCAIWWGKVQQQVKVLKKQLARQQGRR